jgi:CO/xanthine dehydrogenase FAD-binding subunit
MILEYHRPETVEAALQLLNREQPETLPLAGGSVINQPSSRKVAVIDLQALGLSVCENKGNSLRLGATLTLQAMLEKCNSDAPINIPTSLFKTIELEATYNLRQVASVAGTLVAADGRSPFTTAMLALDAMLNILPGDEQVSLGNLLPFRGKRLRGRLISWVSIPLSARLAYEYVARTPADLPILCAALAAWPSGRMRLAMGGFGAVPTLAFDGMDEIGLDLAAQNACSQAGDEWASAEYRQEIAGVLCRRCLHTLKKAEIS